LPSFGPSVGRFEALSGAWLATTIGWKISVDPKLRLWEW